MKRVLLSVIALVSLVPLLSYAEGSYPGNPANGKRIFMEGKGPVVACMTCHGMGGYGTESMGAPRLADLGYEYVVKQLTDLAEGRRVPQGAGAVMPYFAMNLTPEERRDIAAYVNSIDTKPELSDLNELRAQGQPVGSIARGKVIVMYGNGKVSACVSCHQYNGRGAPPMFPMIGQQKYTYLMNQLHNWHDRTRQNDPYQMMEIIGGKLSEQDMQDVAAYLSQAPRGGMGASDYATMSNTPR